MVILTYAFWKNSYNFRGREGGGTSMMLLIFLAIKKYIPYKLVIGKGYISYLKLNQLHQVPVVADVCKTNKRNNKEQ